MGSGSSSVLGSTSRPPPASHHPLSSDMCHQLKYASHVRSMKTAPITANASQLGIPMNSRLPMALAGGASLERFVRWKMVGLPGFEPGSIAPKATSIDQTNPQAPRQGSAWQSRTLLEPGPRTRPVSNQGALVLRLLDQLLCGWSVQPQGGKPFSQRGGGERAVFGGR